MENTENIYKDLSETEINIIDDIFSHGMIISQADIEIPDLKKIKDENIKQFLYDQLIELIKNYTYSIKLTNINNPKEYTTYFVKEEIIKEEYNKLDGKIKAFFHNDISEYIEHTILKQYKKDFDKLYTENNWYISS